jgi:pilus assembly protein CpaC
MNKAPRSRWARTLLEASTVAVLVGAAHLTVAAAAPATTARVVAPDQTLPLEVRQGRLIRLPRPAAAVFVADPQIADVQAHSPTLVYVFGRRSGTTTLFAVDEQEDVLFQREVDVEHHLSGLQRVLGEAAPDSQITVRSVDGGIVLAGTVADPVKAQEVRDIASRYLGENETLINRLEVAAPTQVNLRVRVAEVSRDVTKLFGVNWEAAFQTGNFVFGLASGRAFTSGGGFPFQRLTDQSGTANSVVGRYASNHADINSIIDALESDGLVNILAEPNLTALSGETASFLAGGEFPIPVGQDTTTNKIEIQFKQFGVSLAFTPNSPWRRQDQPACSPRGQRPQRQRSHQARRLSHSRIGHPSRRDDC